MSVSEEAILEQGDLVGSTDDSDLRLYYQRKKLVIIIMKPGTEYSFYIHLLLFFDLLQCHRRGWQYRQIAI
jgi:hypothetical protein